MRAGYEGVADLKCPALYEDRDHRAAPGVEPRLDHGARRLDVGVGPELLELGQGDDVLEQIVQALLGLGRDVHELGVAAPVGGRELLLGQLAAHTVGVRALLVDLVDGDHDRDVRGLGVVDGLDGLRHHPIIGRHDDHGDVRDLRAAGPHRGEGLVARGVEERDRVVVVRRCAG